MTSVTLGDISEVLSHILPHLLTGGKFMCSRTGLKVRGKINVYGVVPILEEETG